MQHALILGANSFLGRAFALKLSESMHLSLCVRSPQSILDFKNQLEKRGKKEIKIISGDLSLDLSAVCDQLSLDLDLVVNCASTTSRLRDSNLPFDKIQEHVSVDLLAPLHLMEFLLKNPRKKKLDYLFISSCLALFNSPDRAIYSSYKRLQESYLEILEKKHAGLFRLCTAYIGKVLPTDKSTRVHHRVAEKILLSYTKKKKLHIGLEGNVLRNLYNLSPLLLRVLIQGRRKVQGMFSSVR